MTTLLNKKISEIARHENCNYQYELDVLRIIGAFNIVLFHYTFRGYAADDMSKLYFPVLGEIFKYGYLGIYIFIILSGYTIILSSHNKSFSNFVFARILRLYPSFWVAICVTSLAALIFQSNRYHVTLTQFFINLTMFSNYVGIKPVDDAHWFMFVILKFYFFISLVLLFDLIKYQKYIAGIWLLLSLTISAYDIPKFGFLLPDYASFFISGMIFYSAKIEGWNTYKYIIQSVSFIFSLYLVHSNLQGFNQHYSTELSVYFVFAVISFIYICMYMSTILKNSIVLPKSVITLSTSTFPLYLIHQNLGFMIFDHFGNFDNKYIVLLATIIFMMLLSLLIVRFIEPNLHKILTMLIRYGKAQGTQADAGKRGGATR